MNVTITPHTLDGRVVPPPSKSISHRLIVAAALAEPKVAKLAEGMELVKSIVVRGRIVNLILKPRA